MKVTSIIISFSLLMLVAAYSCKKTNPPGDPVDRIIGAYIGDLRIIETDSEYMHTDISDTTYHNGTVYVMKRTSTSFCFYNTPPVYTISSFDPVCFQFINDNKYSVRFHPNTYDSANVRYDSLAVEFFPSNGIMRERFLYKIVDTGINGLNFSREITFTGSKLIRL